MAPGSGKSTVARKLGDITGLPVIHIDKIHWQPGWVERPEAERYELIATPSRTDQWIFDGNYSSTFELRAAARTPSSFLIYRRRDAFECCADDRSWRTGRHDDECPTP